VDMLAVRIQVIVGARTSTLQIRGLVGCFPFKCYPFELRMQAINLRGNTTLIPSPSLSICIPRSLG